MSPVAYFGTAFVSLFLVADVATNLPIFLSLTEKYSRLDRRNIARRALLVALGIQLLFVIFGNYIFGYLSIRLYSFSIAAGILLSIVAVEMLFGRKTCTEYQEKGGKGEHHNSSSGNTSAHRAGTHYHRHDNFRQGRHYDPESGLCSCHYLRVYSFHAYPLQV